MNVVDVGSMSTLESESSSSFESSTAIQSTQIGSSVTASTEPVQSSSSSSSAAVSSSASSTASRSTHSNSSTSASATTKPVQSSSSSSSLVVSSSSSSTTSRSTQSSSSTTTSTKTVQSSSSSSSSVVPSSSSSTASQSTPTSSSSSASATTKPVQSSSSSTTQNPVEQPSGANTYKTLNYSEVKGVWISYLDLMTMPSNSASAFRSAIAKVYDNCVELGLNTVYVHARSHSDAYYNSELFPYTKYLSGGFDALEIMIDEAHKRDLSFQAWINPLRGCAVKDASRMNGYKFGDWIGGGTKVVAVNGTYFLNPAYDDVIDYICDGAKEIVANYDVDGLHIDDYFYPTTDASFDSAAFKQSGYTKLSDFRFANCNNMVKSLYSTVKKSNPTAIFGASVQGNNSNNYNYMYIDVNKWCSESGYIDYIMPQIYFGFDNSTEPFEECVKKWDNIAASGDIPLIVGLTVSKIGYTDKWAGEGKNEWITDKEILKRQFLESCEQAQYGGIVLFRYGCIYSPASEVKELVDDEIDALKAVLKQ